jgi:hypothetical protein
MLSKFHTSKELKFTGLFAQEIDGFAEVKKPMV